MSHNHRHQRGNHPENEAVETGGTQTATATAVPQAAQTTETHNGCNVMAALKGAREFAGNVRQRAVAGARATDEAVHSHPYKALAIAAGIGVLVGMFLSRRGSRDA